MHDDDFDPGGGVSLYLAVAGADERTQVCSSRPVSRRPNPSSSPFGLGWVSRSCQKPAGEVYIARRSECQPGGDPTRARRPRAERAHMTS
jgi:hypothetical protein